VNSEPLSEIETPAVVIDRTRLQRNITGMQQLADARGVRLRPHVKTHKCLEIAQLQLAAGAVGITASKTDEALVFIEAGVPSVTVAYPLLDPRKLERLLRAATDHNTDLRLVVESTAGIEALTRAATNQQRKISVFIEIDVGLHRCGVTADNPHLLELARRISDSPALHFIGLLSHAGHAYAAADADAVRQIAADEQQQLTRAKEQLLSCGTPVPEISVGSTPTVLASDTYDGITEIRPGNYVFLDRTPLRLGLATIKQVALTVLATVVSRNDQFLIIDAGSKVLSSDRGAHGTAGSGGYGEAYFGDEALQVVRLSEEHGFIARGAADIPIGAKLRIVPNHACPVVNLAEELITTSGDRWRVAARAKTR
jgi:D-serine deaminase-like pyridoxal phosphate-dependent protein